MAKAKLYYCPSWERLWKTRERTVERMERKVKEHCTEDSDSSPGVVSRDVSKDTAMGVAESATRSRNVGLNKSTQRTIHRKTRCKETFVNGRTEQRKGKVTASPRVKGQGSRVKGQGSRVKGQGSRVKGQGSQVAGRRSEVTGHKSQVTGHRSQVTGHRPQATGHRAQARGQRW